MKICNYEMQRKKERVGFFFPSSILSVAYFVYNFIGIRIGPNSAFYKLFRTTKNRPIGIPVTKHLRRFSDSRIWRLTVWINTRPSLMFRAGKVTRRMATANKTCVSGKN